MSFLKTNEWTMISDILLELYALDDSSEIKRKMLTLLQALIPFDCASFVVIDKKTKKIDEEKSEWIYFEKDVLEKYLIYDYKNDYIFNMLNYSKSIVYRDTDLLETSARIKTRYYTEFLKPNKTPYIAGIIFIYKNKLLGLLNLFRSEDFGDFTEKELYVLEQLKKHFTNIIYKAEQSESTIYAISDGKRQPIYKLGLTLREMEVIDLIVKGLSNHEISEKLVISDSTVKKHIYNIFTKIGVNSRTQLIQNINKLDKSTKK